MLVPFSLIPHLGLRNGRYLTSSYRRTACKLVTKESFREACATFNDTMGRTQSGTAIPLTTFEQDVLADGLRLIVAKNMEADAVLLRYGFSPETGQHVSGGLPDQIRNSIPDWCEVVPPLTHEAARKESETILKQLDETFNPKVPDLDVPEDPSDSDGSNDEVVPQQKVAEVVNAPSEPDRDSTIKTKKRRRKKKYKPCADPFEVDAVANGYVQWFNEAVKVDSYRILRTWKLERDVHQVLYIAMDAVFVNEQAKTHVKGGSTESPEKKPKVGLWTVKLEWEAESYLITDPDLHNATKQLLAYILENELNRRFFVFFTDGEKCIFDKIESFFENWNYTIYLDFLHARDKIFDRLSSALVAKREPDPRKEPELYRKGPKKGEIKKQAMISVSRLYARRAVSILWAGNVQELIRYLRNIPKEDIQKQTELDKLIAYFENKEKYITCYALRRRLGLRVSSCFVEGANKTLVSTRQKDNGMSWRVLGSSVIASHKAILENHEDELWFSKSIFTFRQGNNNGLASIDLSRLGTSMTQFHMVTAEEREKFGPKKTYHHDE